MERLQRQTTLQKQWSFKFQVAAEPLLKRVGYTIIGAQHRPFTSLRKRRGKWTLAKIMKKLGGYLWSYADYVVMKGNHPYVVDVRSQGYVPAPRGRPIDHSTPEEIRVTGQARLVYSRSNIPVLVFLILYRWGGRWEKL